MFQTRLTKQRGWVWVGDEKISEGSKVHANVHPNDQGETPLLDDHAITSQDKQTLR